MTSINDHVHEEQNQSSGGEFMVVLVNALPSNPFTNYMS